MGGEMSISAFLAYENERVLSDGGVVYFQGVTDQQSKRAGQLSITKI